MRILIITDKNWDLIKIHRIEEMIRYWKDSARICVLRPGRARVIP